MSNDNNKNPGDVTPQDIDQQMAILIADTKYSLFRKTRPCPCVFTADRRCVPATGLHCAYDDSIARQSC